MSTTLTSSSRESQRTATQRTTLGFFVGTDPEADPGPPKTGQHFAAVGAGAGLPTELRLAARTIIAALMLLAAVAPVGPAYAASASPDVQRFGKHCLTQSKSRSAGAGVSAHAACHTAMGRLARGDTRSTQIACRKLTRKRASGARISPFAKCVAAGRTLVKNGNGVDRSFLEHMISHHLGAVEMAEIAVAQTQTPYVVELAGTIISTQNAQIAQMRTMVARLKAAGMPAAPLRLSTAQMGLDQDVSSLAGAAPFDVVFVDMMIARHQGAVTLSSVELAKGASPAVRRLAKQISNAQLHEIQTMREFRELIAGSPDPAVDADSPLHAHPGNTDPHPH